MNKYISLGNNSLMTLAIFKQSYNKFWDNTIGYRVISSTPYMLFLTAMAALFFNINLELASLFFFACVLIISMLVSKDLSPCLLPLLLVAMSVLKMYGSKLEDYLILVAPVLILVLLLLFRPLYARTKMNFGYMFVPLFLVGVALAVGGIGSISMRQYFGYVPIFYVLGLGFGMALTYLLMRCYTFSGGVYCPSRVFSKTMLCVGLMGILMVAPVAINAIINDVAWNIQWSNNLSTIMIIAMPFAFYMASKSEKHAWAWFCFGALEALATLLTLSRGGIIFGFTTFIMSVIYAIVIGKKKQQLIFTFILLTGIAIAMLLSDGTIEKLQAILNVSSTETRINLIKTAIDNFKNNVVFGAGMGFVGEYYYPQDWALYWYHSLPFQIIGAMGLIGVIAYGYLFYKRARLCFIAPSKFSMICLVGMIGFTLMGCVNPGEFAPVPYAIIITAMTVYIELSGSNVDYNDLLLIRVGGKVRLSY